METTPEQWQAALKKVYERAATDDPFRARCLSDAKGAINEISGLELPAGFKVRFVERSKETLFVLPPRRGVANEINEDELGKVAGGVDASGGFQGPSTGPRPGSQSCG